MDGIERHEVGEDVDVARDRSTGVGLRKLVLSQGDLESGDVLNPQIRAGRSHVVVTGRRVVIGQRDRRNTQIVSLLRQHRRTVRTVRERGVGMKIYHPSSVLKGYD